MNKLNANAMGLALGVLWALGAFIIVLLAIYGDYGTPWVALMGSVYLGVEPTLTGALIALPWAFVDGFIGGYLIAWLYNKFL